MAAYVDNHMKLAIAVLVASSAVAHAGPLAVEVKPATTTWHVGKPSDVVVRVVNTSTTTQTFRIMSCSWYTHWTSKDATLRSEGWPCHANAPILVTLEPSKALEKTLPMTFAASGARSLDLSFTPYDGGTTTVGKPVAITIEL